MYRKPPCSLLPRKLCVKKEWLRWLSTLPLGGGGEGGTRLTKKKGSRRQDTLPSSKNLIRSCFAFIDVVTFDLHLEFRQNLNIEMEKW